MDWWAARTSALVRPSVACGNALISCAESTLVANFKTAAWADNCGVLPVAGLFELEDLRGGMETKFDDFVRLGAVFGVAGMGGCIVFFTGELGRNVADYRAKSSTFDCAVQHGKVGQSLFYERAMPVAGGKSCVALWLHTAQKVANFRVKIRPRWAPKAPKNATKR